MFAYHAFSLFGDKGIMGANCAWRKHLCHWRIMFVYAGLCCIRGREQLILAWRAAPVAAWAAVAAASTAPTTAAATGSTTAVSAAAPAVAARATIPVAAF